MARGGTNNNSQLAVMDELDIIDIEEVAASGKAKPVKHKKKRVGVRNDIHKEGRKGVGAILKMVPGAEKSSNQKAGDLLVDGKYVEVKTTAKTTVAQVRAVKYIPLVVHQSKRDEWYVIPPHEVVRLAAEKARGQHTEIAFECSLLSCPKPNLTGWDRWQNWRVKDPATGLGEAIRQASIEGDKHKKIKVLMDQAIKDAQALHARIQTDVNKILATPTK